MNANEVVAELLDEHSVLEASVHLPARGRIWVGVFTGPIPGQQVWRSTGLTNRAQALKLARKWEAEARAQRARAPTPRTVSHRVRREGPGRETGPESGLTQREVAVLLGMSERAVRNIEKRALAKLRARLRAFWDDFREHWRSIEEKEKVEIILPSGQLTSAERIALLHLARTAEEVAVIGHLLTMAAAET